jgi:hypothetical protein
MNNNFPFVGLTIGDRRGEIIATGTNKVQLVANGIIYAKYVNIPKCYRRLIRAHMSKNSKAVQVLQAAGITNCIEREERYAWCLFGNFNSQADINPATYELHPDIGMHCTKCQYTMPFCQRRTRILTRQETIVAGMIAEGYTDKEIACRLRKSVRTITTQRGAIQAKLRPVYGERPINSALIAVYAKKEGII